MATVRGIPAEMDLLVASSTGKHVEKKVKEIYIETDDGDLGVLPGHQPEFYSVSVGVLRFKDVEGEEEEKVLFKGFVQIEPDVVRIGVEDFFDSSEVDVEKIEKEISAIKEKLESLSPEEENIRGKLETVVAKLENLLERSR